MSVRFLANAGRIIMSKAGYDAGASLPDQFKLFDSNWGATGLVIASGTAYKSSSAPLVIPFPYPLHYAPAAEAYLTGNGFVGSTDFGGSRVAGYTTLNELVVDGNFSSRNIRYIIWAVSI